MRPGAASAWADGAASAAALSAADGARPASAADEVAVRDALVGAEVELPREPAQGPYVDELARVQTQHDADVPLATTETETFESRGRAVRQERAFQGDRGPRAIPAKRASRNRDAVEHAVPGIRDLDGDAGRGRIEAGKDGEMSRRGQDGG